MVQNDRKASPAKTERTSIKHYSVKQYYLFSYHILSDVSINEKYVHLFHKIHLHHVERYA